MHRFKPLLLVFLLALSIPTLLPATEYQIDPEHSEIGFKIRHMGISNIYGRFGEFSGSFFYDPEKPYESSARATILMSSIDTFNKGRDDHLRGQDFFHVEKFPEMSFVGSEVSDVSEEGMHLKGELTLRGITRPVQLKVEKHGTVDDSQGRTRSGFTATARIHRGDFGLTWNRSAEPDWVLVGDYVEITIEVEGVQD